MQIITKSIRIIDYDAQQIYTRATPATFDVYVSELIDHINGNKNVREFKTRSTDTEVIGCIKHILRAHDNAELVSNKTDSIASRLLIKEIDAQRRVARMDTNVQKGSLVQALLFDEETNQASINKSTHVGQPVFSVLFALFSLAGDSPPASKRTKIPRKFKAVRCEAVLPEQKCSQTRKRPQRILCVFSRALTPYEGISARQNRVCPCQSTQTSLDKGTQRKTTENELPSLTQCTA